ncbi:MAG: hypothetical protein JWM83_3274 [Candidatus Angelobacter sp.]|nr:hypothetical protein [Candidatus Angelobacter sp.]
MNEDTKKPSPKEVAVADIQITNPDAVKSAYCNNIQIAVTPWDLRLLCTEVEVAPNGDPVQSIRANIVMAIAHAEALHNALGSTLDGLKKQQEQKKQGQSAEPAAKK